MRAIRAVVSAFFGVQSEAARKQDFQYHNPVPFIIAGIVMALMLVLTLIAVVSWVLDK
ncbi:DUF2970 domain-containing protein [Corallincola holothuriorum]|uniref:DUF2970 domain-containing protein n=1 Tax=Corallincola holothuriorum TaxID=2282215 RepID=UPI001F23741F|nr:MULTISPECIES: DUF2970 domain-containing protein [Corallincola]